MHTLYIYHYDTNAHTSSPILSRACSSLANSESLLCNPGPALYPGVLGVDGSPLASAMFGEGVAVLFALLSLVASIYAPPLASLTEEEEGDCGSSSER